MFSQITHQMLKNLTLTYTIKKLILLPKKIGGDNQLSNIISHYYEAMLNRQESAKFLRICHARRSGHRMLKALGLD